jgi:hypothetical protein
MILSYLSLDEFRSLKATQIKNQLNQFILLQQIRHDVGMKMIAATEEMMGVIEFGENPDQHLSLQLPFATDNILHILSDMHLIYIRHGQR